MPSKGSSICLIQSRWGLNKAQSFHGLVVTMAYCSVFLYRVPRRKAEAFVHALEPIMKLFEDAGALSDELLRPKDMTAKFGGASLPSAVELAKDEELWIEIAKFKDASHMKDVHSQVAKNPDLEKLHSRFDLLISGKQVYHAEFESLRPQPEPRN
jgi:uncharacterized protein YbaA (DUF1428 family)